MGKEEIVKSSEDTNADSDTSSKETTEAKNPEEPQDNKQNVDGLRQVIKVNGEENQETKQESDNDTPPKAPKPDAPTLGESKFEDEQIRSILQNIKDFDLQIKKNQEDIGKLLEKIDGISNDLDDLVSLYEIVSEQMNPFVGLSKVTKKRIDALENFTQEIETLKTRVDDLESFKEKNKFITEKPTKTKTSPETKTVHQPESGEEKPSLTAETVNGSLAPNTSYNMNVVLSDEDAENIVNMSFEALFAEQNINNTINEFLLSLK